jgi:alpha-tubulin suppressor-like RCC1 family protein
MIRFTRTAFAALAFLTLTVEAAVAPRQPGRTSAGEVLGWGANASSASPITIGNLGAVKAIAQGTSHSLALTTDGKVWAWGSNVSGQLGNGSNADSNPPVPVTNLNGVVSIATSGAHSLALTSEGRVWAWGGESLGELGDGILTGSRNVPIAVNNLSRVTAIAAGLHQSLALTDDGKVWNWGSTAMPVLVPCRSR